MPRRAAFDIGRIDAGIGQDMTGAVTDVDRIGRPAQHFGAFVENQLAEFRRATRLTAKLQCDFTRYEVGQPNQPSFSFRSELLGQHDDIAIGQNFAVVINCSHDFARDRHSRNEKRQAANRSYSNPNIDYSKPSILDNKTYPGYSFSVPIAKISATANAGEQAPSAPH